MMKYLVSISLFLVGFAVVTEPTNSLREKYRISEDVVPYTYKYDSSVVNFEALKIWGAYLYDETSLSKDLGQSSCQASCHVKGNHLAPKGLQIGTGGYTDHDGFRKPDPFFPDDLMFDEVGNRKSPNSPQVENVAFKSKVLHNCVTDATGQASERFGFMAHNLDWTQLKGNTFHERYCMKAFGDGEITEHRISMALVSFQESSYSKGNPLQKWANGATMGHRFNNWISLFDKHCYSCHSGKGLDGEGLIMSEAVFKDGTDTSFLKSRTVAVRSPYNNDAFDVYGWVGDYKSLYGFYNKHLHMEGLDTIISAKEKRQLYAGLVKYLND